MAGTLTIGTLSDGTNSASATDAIKGSARAWVNFTGVTTATIRASYNVSSVFKNGTGDYTINFTNAMADSNYTFALSTRKVDDTLNAGIATAPLNSDTKTTTQFRFRRWYQTSTAAYEDGNELGAIIYR